MFCGECETLVHLFVKCSRLTGFVNFVKDCCVKLGQTFTWDLFIFGPKYSVANRDCAVFFNFLFGHAKMAVWLSRRNKMEGSGITEPVTLMKMSLSTQLKIEFSYYKIIGDLDSFTKVRALEECICKVNEEGQMQLTL